MNEAEENHQELMGRILAEADAKGRLSNVAPVTKADMDSALEAWNIAREKATHEQMAWASVLQSHKVLIESFRANGHTRAAAENAFRQISTGHQEALMAAWKHMDVCCRAYLELQERFKAEQGQTGS